MKAAGVHLIGGCHGHRLRPAAAEQGVHGVQLAAPQDIGCGERCDAAAGARLDHTVQQCPGHALSADQGVHKEAHQYAAVLCPADRGGAAGGLVPNSSQAGQIPGGLAGHLHNGGQQILGEGTWTDGAQRAERKPGHDKIPLLTQNILLALFVPERPVSASFYRYQYNTRRRGVALQFMTIQRFSRRFATNLKIVPYNMDRERTSKSLLKWTAACGSRELKQHGNACGCVRMHGSGNPSPVYVDPGALFRLRAMCGAVADEGSGAAVGEFLSRHILRCVPGDGDTAGFLAAAACGKRTGAARSC